MNIPRYHHYHAAKGVSLLLTLIIISAVVVLLTLMARLVTVDKRVSAGYSNILRAELAAKAGVADASEVLLDLFQKYPDSATYWDTKLGATETPGTVFMFRDLPPNREYVGSNGAAKVYARPLISGAQTKEFYPTDEYAKTLPATAVVADKSTDINLVKCFNDRHEKGWIGAPPGKTTLPGKTNLEIRVPWVEIKDEDGQVVSRYAYWVEDESFKLNVNKTHERLRGDLTSETDADTGTYQPLASLRGLFDSMVSGGVHTARTKLTMADQRMLSPLQIGHSAVLPNEMTAEQFGREYRYLLTTESTGLDLTRTGAKRLNLNKVAERSLENIPTVAYGSTADARTGPDLSVALAQENIGRATGQIAKAIQHQAPQFGQRFYRRQANNVLVPTPNAAGVTAKNNLDVAATASPGDGMPHAEIYVNKIAANLYDYISQAVNPTVIDRHGNLWLGKPVYSDKHPGLDAEYLYDVMGPEAPGETEALNELAVVGKKRVPFLSEYMLHAKQLSRYPNGYGPKPGASPATGYADYEIEIDHYFEFWNMTDKGIVPANGDLGPDPYLVVENQAAISVDNRVNSLVKAPNGQDVPAGRPFEIKLDQKFGRNGQDVDLVFPAGAVTLITTDPNYETSSMVPAWLKGKNAYVAKVLYAPGTDNPCSDTTTFSEPPYAFGEGSTTVVMDNVRRYKVTSWDLRQTLERDSSQDHEIQFGPDMIGSTSMKLVLGNQYGLLEAHPSLAMGPQKSNMVVFKPGRTYALRGSFTGGGAAGLFDPRSNLEAIRLRIRSASTDQENSEYILQSSMGTLNGQTEEDKVARNSHLGEIRTSAFPVNQLWDTDKMGPAQGAASAPMLLADGPMQSIGELGRIFDPLRVAASALKGIEYRRAGGRTLTVGQPDAAWDGTRTTALTDPEMKFQTSRSRGWAAWRLADIFTVRDDAKFKDAAKVEVEGLYNPNGILRDDGMALRAMLEGVRFGSGNQSDPALEGNLFDTSKTTEILEESKRANIFPTAAGSGGQALANYLAQRLTRSAPRKFSPLWEPGELSQLDFFALKIGSTSFPFIQSGVKNDVLNDQGREEIFRRLTDMMTTRGNTYSIYVVGQTLNKLGNPIATKAQRVTVRLRPVFDPVINDEADDFDPEDAEAVEKRFRAPDAYTVEVVNVEDA